MDKQSYDYNDGPKRFLFAINKSGGALARGDVVILDTTNTGAAGTTPSVTTTTTQDDPRVSGVIEKGGADGEVVIVQTYGYHDAVKVMAAGAIPDIAVGDRLSTYTTAKNAAKIKGTAYATTPAVTDFEVGTMLGHALQAATTDTTIKAWIGPR